MTISIWGRFKADIGSNATTWWFVDASHAGLVGWGDEEFCSRVEVYQTIDEVTQAICPPVEGDAVLQTELTIDGYWPSVSKARFCYECLGQLINCAG